MHLVSVDEFESLVAAALDEIPDHLADQMENVVVVVEDEASPDDQAGRQGVLLGLYKGVELTRRGPIRYQGAVPDRIIIYRLPHCRLAHSEEQLRRRVRHTVLHEVGHHFGMTESRLHELGWG